MVFVRRNPTSDAGGASDLARTSNQSGSFVRRSAGVLVFRRKRIVMNERTVLVASAALFASIATLAVAADDSDTPVANDSAGEVFTPEHVAKLRMVSSARIAPDGQRIAYVLRVPRTPVAEPSGSSWAELHVIGADGTSRPYVSGEVSVGQVEWTPDGTGISFLAKRGKDAHRSLYVIPIDGGEASKVLSHKSDIASYSWSPDGKRVAFIATDPVADDRKSLVEKGFNQQIYEEEFRPTRVLVGSINSDDEPRALEIEGFPSDLHWSPRGDRLALTIAPTPLIDDWFMKRKIHVVDVESAQVFAVFDTPGKLGPLAWNPSGTKLAFLSAEDIHDPNAGRLMVVPAVGGAPKQLPFPGEGDFDAIVWKDDFTVSYIASVGATCSIGEYHIDAEKPRVLVEKGSLVASDLSISRDGSRIAFLSSHPEYPNEVFALRTSEESPRRLTTSNDWLDAMRFAKQEIVRYKARDGLELEGILIRPLDEKEGERYPLILRVHGGPEAHDRNGWTSFYSGPGQVASARGFAVFHPNYRGSTGRGVAFSKLGQSDYAGKEFDDLVDTVDHLVSIGLVDKDKVGVTGGSYGGFATAWCSTYHSERFAAGVMFVGISDQISKFGTTDIPNEMFLVHARKKLYGNWEWFLERSPIYHVEKSRTPLLILHGKEDTRVHPSQSMELYRHLRHLGKTPVRLVLYPGEGHGNRKSAARFDYHLRMLRWFEHYLKGDGGEPPAPELEYAPEKEKDEDSESSEEGSEDKAGE